MNHEKLIKGAKTVIRQCLKVKPGEKALILTDKNISSSIPQILLEALKEVNAISKIKIIEPLEFDGQEPSEEIASLMKNFDVIILATSKSLTHTKAREDACKAGARIASMPGITEFSFIEGGLTADYEEVKELVEKIHEKVKGSKEIEITSDNGTNFKAKVEGRRWFKDDGMIDEKGKFSNLPAGEVFIAPLEGTSEGILVFDKMGRFGENIKIEVKNGIAEKIEGSELLEKVIQEIGEKARNIAEIGIGANPKAKVIGNVLEDEKVLGTVHVALGNNFHFGGKIDVPFHADGIILKPNLEVDGKLLIKNGKWIF